MGERIQVSFIGRTKKRAERAKAEVKKRTKEAKAEARRIAREKAHNWRRMIGTTHLILGTLVVAMAAAGLSYSGVIEQVDQKFSDTIYHAFAKKQNDQVIKMISIDKKTEKKLGKYKEWSRDRTAQLINILNKDKDMAPSVIGIDLDFSIRKDKAGDQGLVDACSQHKNVCMSAFAIMEGALLFDDLPDAPITIDLKEEPSSEENAWDENENMMGGQKISYVKMPFDELRNEITAGIINNTRSSDDGFVRNAFSGVTVDGEEIDSFAIAAYKMYQDIRGKEYQLPKLDEEDSFNFTYTRQGQEYALYSFSDVLSGKISPNAFKDCIVLVGDYTEDDADTYMAPNQRETQMTELEIQANILEALLEQRTGQQVSKGFMAVYYAFFMAVFFIATSYSSDKFTVMVALLVNVLQLLSCWGLNLLGYYIHILVPVILIVVVSLYNLVVRYMIALQNQYALEDVFKKYVDESVVTELGKDGLFEAHIGVESRDIAVLFVDIRGFTTLSECLPPVQVVEILNHYLSLVAQAVSKYEGTLDKFIGDAAMAVFNSPVDLEDYEYKAVCAALDLCSNASYLSERCEKEYGKQVMFGIGIQCGEAVIGNIGCETRMDYTAIGDTVNTAARLEGIAAPGQILISGDMRQRLKERIRTAFAGDYELKGKKLAVPVYAVEGLIGGEDE